MQRRYAAKSLHLFNRKIADADGADLALSEQGLHCRSGFFDRYKRIGPMNLIDVDVVGSKPTQGVLDLVHDAAAAGVAKYAPVLPFESNLGGNQHFVTQASLGYRFANDFFRATEAIDRRRIDSIDAVVQRRLNG